MSGMSSRYSPDDDGFAEAGGVFQRRPLLGPGASQPEPGIRASRVDHREGPQEVVVLLGAPAPISVTGRGVRGEAQLGSNGSAVHPRGIEALGAGPGGDDRDLAGWHALAGQVVAHPLAHGVDRGDERTLLHPQGERRKEKADAAIGDEGRRREPGGGPPGPESIRIRSPRMRTPSRAPPQGSPGPRKNPLREAGRRRASWAPSGRSPG